MEELLNETVPEDFLKNSEKQYNRELELDGVVTTETKFGYAVCLIRSKYHNDTRKGIMIMEDMFRSHPDTRRDCMYYLAFGNARIKNYTEALKYCEAFLNTEQNDQVQSLQVFIKKQVDKEMAKTAAIASGAVILIGIVGFGLSLVKK